MKVTELGKIVIINKRLETLRQEFYKYAPGKVPESIMSEYNRLSKRKSKLSEILPIPKQMPRWAQKM
jgi:hypothetical protein